MRLTRVTHKYRLSRFMAHATFACVDEPVEFPDVETIRRRTTAFQQRFVEHFMMLYLSLPSSVQTSALSVAVRRRSSQPVNHIQTLSSSAATSQDIVVSLYQYLEAAASCAEVPLQLPASEYALTISPNHFELIRQARIDGCDDPAALARLIVADVAAEGAAELARAFEYQLMLLGDEEGLAARLGAQRGAERAMEYLKRCSRHVDVNSLLRGAVEGQPLDAPATVSAILGQHRELHWNVDDMYLRPGLRRERLLVAGAVDSLGGYGTPWQLYASTTETDSTVYGYRGHLLARDFHSEWLRGGRQPLYHLDVDEEVAYDTEVPWRPDDFHRTYRPYRRLIGSAVMASYAALPDEEKTRTNLGEFVQRLQGDAFRRDEVEPVFRPLTSVICREQLNSGISNSNSTLLTAREFRHGESTRSSHWMPLYNSSSYAESSMSAMEHCRQEPVPATNLTNNSSAFQSAERVHDRKQTDQVLGSLTRPLSPTFRGLCPDVSVTGTNSTSDAYDQDIPEVNHRGDVTLAEQHSTSSTPARRQPPPVVKPKPSLELRRRQSAMTPATTASNSQTMTSLPATKRQISAPVDGPDSTPEVTVRFPTVEELFGRELAEIRRASTLLPGYVDTDNSRTVSTLPPPRTGSINMTSQNDVTAGSSQPETTLILSDI